MQRRPQYLWPWFPVVSCTERASEREGGRESGRDGVREIQRRRAVSEREREGEGV